MTNPSYFLPLQIRFNDIDLWGHVNNAVFQIITILAGCSFLTRFWEMPV